MRFLKVSTSVAVHMGPFVDQTDGYTLETGLTPSANQIELYKAASPSALDVSARVFTHVAGGVYRLSLVSTDVDTAGPLMIHARITGARSVMHEFNVLHASAYDALVSGTPLPANVTQITGNATAATLMVFSALGIKNFTVGSGSSTTRVATNLTESVSDHWNGRTVIFVTGTLAGQAASITDYNGSTNELTVSALTAAPTSGDTAVIV